MVSNTSGSGKTTVARRLAHNLRVPHVELDAIQHLSGWRRARRYFGREELWNGNREQLREALFDPDGLFRFAIRNYRPRRAALPRLLAPTNHVRVRNDREIDALMAAIAASTKPPLSGKKRSGGSAQDALVADPARHALGVQVLEQREHRPP